MIKGTADNSTDGSTIRPETTLVSHSRKSFVLALLVSCLALVSASAYAYPTGVRNSPGPQRLNEKQLQQLQESLRNESGLTDLSFDSQGGLALGDRTHVRGGSATARTLLIAAVDSRNLFELESHAGSPEIAFARILESGILDMHDTGQRINISRVQIDFADFDQLWGPRQAKMALDIGLALLHELVHGVLKLQDTQDIDQIGDCDYHVNQIRRELQLPERLYYNPGISVTKMAGRNIVTANLQFVERSDPGAKPREVYRLYWLPSEVSPRAKNIAQLQEGTMRGKRR